MEKLGRKIVRFRIPIFIIGLLLLIPSVFGYINTRVNYDVLYYLPDSIETMQGQDILVDEFGTGAYSMFICEGMENKDVAKLKEQIEDVEHVSKVVWYDSFADISIPMEMLPEDIREAFNADDSTLMFIIFDTTTSADETMDAIENIRALAGKQCFLSGMSAIVTDTKNLAESEVAIYVLIAVVLSCIVLALTMESYLIPDCPKISDFVVKHHVIFAILFVVLFIPFAYFQAHASVYYNLDASLPDTLPSVQANTKLSEEYDMGAAHMILLDKDLDAKQKYNMIADIEKVDGVKQVLGLESIIGPAFPESMIPEDVKEILESDNYELMLIMNEYAVASDEVNSQLSEINTILKQYDPTGMLVGEAPCTKDLIEITDHDFAVVSAVSILAVFFIIFFVFKSISLPVILVMVIEGAIFINMGIPFLTGTKLPFIASIVIGTIQLGATVDYAILITSRYEKERGEGKSKKDAIQIAHKTSIRPVMVSAFSFFAATFGVGMYSQIDMISSLCLLMARGALISMCAVLLFLPAMFWLFDGIICKTSLNFRRKH